MQHREPHKVGNNPVAQAFPPWSRATRGHPDSHTPCQVGACCWFKERDPTRFKPGGHLELQAQAFHQDDRFVDHHSCDVGQFNAAALQQTIGGRRKRVPAILFVGVLHDDAPNVMAQDGAVAVVAHLVIAEDIPHPHSGSNLGTGADHPGLNLRVRCSRFANHRDIAAGIRPRTRAAGDHGPHGCCCCCGNIGGDALATLWRLTVNSAAIGFDETVDDNRLARHPAIGDTPKSLRHGQGGNFVGPQHG